MALWKKNEVKVDLASYRHYIRGEKKIGKTTLFVKLMEKLYGDSEKGLLISLGNERGWKALDGAVYVDCPTWSDLIEVTDELVENKNDNNFKCVCFDTVDEWISLAQKEVQRLDYKKTGERHEFNACLGGYGNGRKKVEELINSVLTKIEDSGYGIFMIGHVKYRDIKEKNGDEYQKFTSNLSSDYDGIFANKADIIAMIATEKDIEDGFVTETQRYLHFRSDGFVDAGGRFPNIEGKVEFSADNYIKTVTDAIKKSIKSHEVTDEYLEKKAKQEQKEREDFYQANKEKLMSEDPELDEYEKNLKLCEDLKVEIKNAITAADTETKKALQAKLKEAGLPIKYQSNNDPETLAKILSIVAPN